MFLFIGNFDANHCNFELGLRVEEHNVKGKRDSMEDASIMCIDLRTDILMSAEAR